MQSQPYNRDTMFRCKICKKLQNQVDAVRDKDKGYICQNGCEEPYNQPPYESPLNDTEK